MHFLETRLVIWYTASAPLIVLPSLTYSDGHNQAVGLKCIVWKHDLS